MALLGDDALIQSIDTDKENSLWAISFNADAVN
jgi:hypothetical protein